MLAVEGELEERKRERERKRDEEDEERAVCPDEGLDS